MKRSALKLEKILAVLLAVIGMTWAGAASAAAVTGSYGFRWSLSWDYTENPDDISFMNRGGFQKIPFYQTYSATSFGSSNTSIYKDSNYVAQVDGIYTFDTCVNFYDIENGSVATLAIKGTVGGTDVTLAADSRTYSYNGLRFVMCLHTTALLKMGDTVRVELMNQCHPSGWTSSYPGVKIGGPDIIKGMGTEEWGSGGLTYFAGYLVVQK